MSEKIKNIQEGIIIIRLCHEKKIKKCEYQVYICRSMMYSPSMSAINNQGEGGQSFGGHVC